MNASCLIINLFREHRHYNNNTGKYTYFMVTKKPPQRMVNTHASNYWNLCQQNKNELFICFKLNFRGKGSFDIDLHLAADQSGRNASDHPPKVESGILT